MADTPYRGTVKWFNHTKGYGFIGREPEKDGDNPPDVFVHYSVIESKGYRKLDEGDVVEFLIVKGPKGKDQAKDVRVITHASSSQD